jgi:hypothetical protein
MANVAMAIVLNMGLAFQLILVRPWCCPARISVPIIKDIGKGKMI